MNHDADIDRALTAWMREEGPEHVPPGLLERVASITARRRPRTAAIARLTGAHVGNRTWQPGILLRRKERIMLRHARVFATVAIIAILTAVGWNIFRGPLAAGVGGPSIAPSARPTATASASESPLPVAVVGPLAEGRYAAGSFLVGLAYTVPPTWGIVDDHPSHYVLQRFPPDSAAYPRAGGVYCPSGEEDWGASCSNRYSQIVIQLDPVLATNARECEGLAAVGAPTSVDGMMVALAADPRFAVRAQESVTIGGFNGQAFDISMSPGWTETCKWSDGKPAGLIFTVARPPGPVFGITNEELEHVILLDLGEHIVSIGFRQGWRAAAESIVNTFEFGP